MCDIELEPSDVWSEVARSARKAHRCSACRGAIAVGERYTVHFSKYEGEVVSGKICAACVTAREEFATAHFSMICTPSYFPTLLRECIDENDEESVTRWKPMLTAMRARASPARRPSSGANKDANGGGGQTGSEG